MRTTVVLALASLACDVFLLFVVGPQGVTLDPGDKYAVSFTIGQEISRGLMLLVLAMLGAGVGHLVTRSAHDDQRYVARLTGGLLVALTITAMTWVGQQARLLADVRPKNSKLMEAPFKSAEVDAPAPARKEPTHLMMVVLDAIPGRPCAIYLAPTPESTCLLAIRKYQEVGAHVLTVKPIETRGEPLTGRALEIHCVTPAGTMIGTHVRKRADEIQCSKGGPMQPEHWRLMADAINIGFYVILLGLIYWRVRRNVHPSRSMLWSYLGSVGIVATAFILTAFAMLMYSHMNPSYTIMGRALHPIETILVFGSMYIGWLVSRWWIRQPLGISN